MPLKSLAGMFVPDPRSTGFAVASDGNVRGIADHYHAIKKIYPSEWVPIKVTTAFDRAKQCSALLTSIGMGGG